MLLALFLTLVLSAAPDAARTGRTVEWQATPSLTGRSVVSAQQVSDVLQWGRRTEAGGLDGVKVSGVEGIFLFSCDGVLALSCDVILVVSKTNKRIIGVYPGLYGS